jgi:hypothetical protein
MHVYPKRAVLVALDKEVTITCSTYIGYWEAKKKGERRKNGFVVKWALAYAENAENTPGKREDCRRQ